MKLQSVNPLIAATLLILSWQSLALADNSNRQESTSSLQPLVVTGTRTLKAENDGPVRTEVVSEDDIKARQYRDAAEALMDIPGVMLVDSTGKEGKSPVMQGLGGEHVLVLIDGAPVMQNASSGVDLTQIPASDIERIEVVKGGASALYGGQAMGGVINIITKSPTDRPHYEMEIGRDQATEGSYNGYAPSYNFAKAHVSGRTGKPLSGETVGSLGYKFSFSQRKQKSIDRDETTISRDTPDVDRQDALADFEQRITAKTKLQYEFGYNKEKNRNYTAHLLPDSSWTATTNDGDVERFRVKLGSVTNLSQTSTLNVYLLGERTKDLLSLDDDPKTVAQENLKTSIFERERAEAQWDFSPAASQVTTLGLVAERTSLNQGNDVNTGNGTQHTSEVDDKSSSSLEAYAQNDWMFEGHEWIAGLRVTHDPAFGQHFDPKINYLVQPKWFDTVDTALRFSIGTGYRIPNLKERFYVLDHRSFAGYIVYGNENLRPEESVSYQAGLELNRNREISASTNFFVNQVRGLILTIEEPATNSERVFRFENLNQALIYGWENSVNWQATSRFRLTPSFTYTKAVNSSTQQIVPNRPFYLASMNARLDIGGRGANANATLRYFGDSYADIDNTQMYAAYSLVDLRYNHPLDKNTDLYVGVKNIFDAQRAAKTDSADLVYDQRPEEGRIVVVGFRLQN